jgi:hypothetical protein
MAETVRVVGRQRQAQGVRRHDDGVGLPDEGCQTAASRSDSPAGSAESGRGIPTKQDPGTRHDAGA